MTGRSVANSLAVNLGGAAVLVVAAYGAGWFKSNPWKRAS